MTSLRFELVGLQGQRKQDGLAKVVVGGVSHTIGRMTRHPAGLPKRFAFVCTCGWKGEHTGSIADAEGERPIEAGSDTGHGDRTRTENIVGAILRDEPLIAPLEDSISTSEFLHAIWDSYTLGIRVPVHRAGKTG